MRNIIGVEWRHDRGTKGVMSRPLRVLIIEDSEDDVLFLLRELRRGGYDTSYERVDTGAAMEAALDRKEWDLVLSDHSMPSFSSSAALELLNKRGIDLPFIIVSGQIGEGTAVTAMRAGAHDYIMKDNLARLNTAIARELREAESRRERRRAEEELKVSETRFRLMIEQSPLSIQIFSPEGRTLRVNRAWEELWGVTLDQIPDYNILRDQQLVEKGIMPYIERGFAGQPASIPPVEYVPEETIPKVSDVPSRWVRAFIYPVKDEDGTIREVALIHENITERREAEEALREAEEKYRSIFENAVEGIFQSSVGGRLITANPAMAHMLGYGSPEELLNEIVNVSDQLYVDSERRAEFAELMRGDSAVSGFEIEIYRKDGSRVWVSVSARCVRDESGYVVGYEGTLEDITARKRAGEELREIRDAERRRIARDLHDVVMQDLVYTLQTMEITQMRSTDEDLESQLEEQIKTLRRAVKGLRSAIYNLRREEVEERSFLHSLESLVELNRQVAPGRKLDLVVDEGFPEEISGEGCVQLLRMIQEALVNVRRHSQARNVRISVETVERGILAEIRDDGRGFDPENDAGFGIAGMQERAFDLDASLEVASEPGSGTRVRMWVPLKSLVENRVSSSRL